jgi:multidrug efflux system membrane fusion protein
VVLAPAAAIQFGNDGTFVYVVNGDSKVNIRKLKVGASDGHSVILEGLSAGDRLVLEGTDRLREGTKVDVVEDSSQVPTTPASTCRARTPGRRDHRGEPKAGA